MELIDFYFKLLEGLYEKQLRINQILELLKANEMDGFLEEEIEMSEKFLVNALGGKEKHWQYIKDRELFYDFGYRGVLSREHLVNEIKFEIENDID